MDEIIVEKVGNSTVVNEASFTANCSTRESSPPTSFYIGKTSVESDVHLAAMSKESEFSTCADDVYTTTSYALEPDSSVTLIPSSESCSVTDSIPTMMDNEDQQAVSQQFLDDGENDAVIDTTSQMNPIPKWQQCGAVNQDQMDLSQYEESECSSTSHSSQPSGVYPTIDIIGPSAGQELLRTPTNIKSQSAQRDNGTPVVPLLNLTPILTTPCSNTRTGKTQPISMTSEVGNPLPRTEKRSSTLPSGTIDAEKHCPLEWLKSVGNPCPKYEAKEMLSDLDLPPDLSHVPVETFETVVGDLSDLIKNLKGQITAYQRSNATLQRRVRAATPRNPPDSPGDFLCSPTPRNYRGMTQSPIIESPGCDAEEDVLALPRACIDARNNSPHPLSSILYGPGQGTLHGCMTDRTPVGRPATTPRGLGNMTAREDRKMLKTLKSVVREAHELTGSSMVSKRSSWCTVDEAVVLKVVGSGTQKYLSLGGDHTRRPKDSDLIELSKLRPAVFQMERRPYRQQFDVTSFFDPFYFHILTNPTNSVGSPSDRYKSWDVAYLKLVEKEDRSGRYLSTAPDNWLSKNRDSNRCYVTGRTMFNWNRKEQLFLLKSNPTGQQTCLYNTCSKKYIRADLGTNTVSWASHETNRSDFEVVPLAEYIAAKAQAKIQREVCAEPLYPAICDGPINKSETISPSSNGDSEQPTVRSKRKDKRHWTPRTVRRSSTLCHYSGMTTFTPRNTIERSPTDKADSREPETVTPEWKKRENRGSATARQWAESSRRSSMGSNRNCQTSRSLSKLPFEVYLAHDSDENLSVCGGDAPCADARQSGDVSTPPDFLFTANVTPL